MLMRFLFGRHKTSRVHDSDAKIHKSQDDLFFAWTGKTSDPTTPRFVQPNYLLENNGARQGPTTVLIPRRAML